MREKERERERDREKTIVCRTRHVDTRKRGCPSHSMFFRERQNHITVRRQRREREEKEL